MTTRGATPPQTVGPFFHGGLLREGLNVLVSSATEGQRIRIEGHVYDGNRAPLDDAVVEIWQADARGRYHHPADARSAPPDPAFAGFGRAGTDEAGFYWFETVRPGRVPAGAGTEQAPHINVAVFARGLLHHVTTRLYFPDEPVNETDPVLRRVPADRRSTLVARRVTADGKVVYRFDVILQGDGETVFFEL